MTDQTSSEPMTRVEPETPLIDPHARVSKTEDMIRRAIFDPAKYVPRGRYRVLGGHDPEALYRWQARAVMAAIEPPPLPPVPRWARNLSRALYGLAVVLFVVGLVLLVSRDSPYPTWVQFVMPASFVPWVAAMMLRGYRPEPKVADR